MFEPGPDLAAVLARSTPERIEAAGRFDAIVVGGGAAGGLAAQTFCEAGLKVLLLDAGMPSSWRGAPLRKLMGEGVRRIADPASLRFMPPRLLYKGQQALRMVGRRRQPVQTQCYAWERLPDAFVDDIDHPYVTPPDAPFTWIRTRTLGGRVIVPGHGRQYFRLGRDDFAPSDGLTPRWPFAPDALDPWYAKVEDLLALRGSCDQLSTIPDSHIAVPLVPSPAERELVGTVRQRWPHATPVLGRYAPPLRSLDRAAAAGGLVVRRGAAVRRVLFDGAGAADGVEWVDQSAGRVLTARAPIVFLCASALETTRILMLSDRDHPRGLDRASGMLGANLMDHVMIKADGVGPALAGAPVALEDGRCIYLPRFDARDQAVPATPRGFGVQVYQVSIGGDRSFFTAVSFSEMLPDPANRVRLDDGRRDRFGIPALSIACRYGAAEIARAREQTEAVRALAELTGTHLSRLDRAPPPPGSAVHECGTARMGDDPTTSVLDPDNQCWAAKGVYVTDSAAFPSQGSQNPTLTVMALTARACAHAAGGR